MCNKISAGNQKRYFNNTYNPILDINKSCDQTTQSSINKASYIAQTCTHTDTTNIATQLLQQRKTTTIASQNHETKADTTEIPTCDTSANNVSILSNAGSRKLSIIQKIDGSTSISMSAKTIQKLYISGGGSKGAAIVGFLKSLQLEQEKQNKDINNRKILEINEVYGTSIGSQMATMLATGMNYDDVKSSTDNIKPYSLLCSAKNTKECSVHFNVKKAQEHENKLEDSSEPYHEEMASVNIIMKPSILKEKYNDINLMQKILAAFYIAISFFFKPFKKGKMLEFYIEYTIAEHLLKVIYERNLQNNDKLTTIIKKIKTTTNGRCPHKNHLVTFKDLSILAEYIPEITKLNIAVTMVQKDAPAQLMMFNNENTPDDAIATAVKYSCSYPFVFPACSQDNFLSVPGYDIKYTDGGCMLNTPLDSIVYPSFDYSDIDKDNNIILVFENKYKETDYEYFSNFKKTKYGIKHAITHKLAGARIIAQRDMTTNKLEKLKNQTIVIPITIKEGRCNKTMNPFLRVEDINILQEKTAKVVSEHLENRKNTMREYNFNNLTEALFSLPDEVLEEINEYIPEQVTPVLQMKEKSMAVIKNIEQEMQQYDSHNKNTKQERIMNLINLLNTLEVQFGDNADFNKWFTYQLNDEKNYMLQRFLDICANRKLEPTTILLEGALNERKRRGYIKMVYNIILFSVDKYLYTIFQSEHNKEVLCKAKQDLLAASSKQDITNALNHIIKNYKPTIFDKFLDLIDILKNMVLNIFEFKKDRLTYLSSFYRSFEFQQLSSFNS